MSSTISEENAPFQARTSGFNHAQAHFHPHIPTIEYDGVPFTLQSVRRALFDSTYRSPITLLFQREKADEELNTDIRMTVELAEAVYESSEPDRPGCYERPEWYLYGMAHFTGPAGESITVPMHAFLTISEAGEITATVVQVLTDQKQLKAEV